MDSDLLITLGCAIIGSGALQALVTEMIRKSQERKAKPTALEQAVKLLLQDRLTFLMTRDIQAGETTARMRSFISKGMEAYKGLEGNGDMKALYADYQRIPVKYA